MCTYICVYMSYSIHIYTRSNVYILLYVCVCMCACARVCESVCKVFVRVCVVYVYIGMWCGFV